MARAGSSPRSSPPPSAGRDVPPDVLLHAAVAGDRVALARLLTRLERGGPDGRVVAGLAYRRHADAQTVGVTGPPGAGKSTLVDRLVRTGHDRGGRAARGARRRPLLAVLGRRHPRRPRPHAGPRPRRRRVHPLDGVAWPSRGVGPGRARGHPVAGARWGSRWWWSRPWASARSRSRWPGLPTPRWWCSTPSGVTPCRPTRPGSSRRPTSSSSTRPTCPVPATRGATWSRCSSSARRADWRPPIVNTVATTGDGVDALWDEIGRHHAHLEVIGRVGVAPCRSSRARVPGGVGGAHRAARSTGCAPRPSSPSWRAPSPSTAPIPTRRPRSCWPRRCDRAPSRAPPEHVALARRRGRGRADGTPNRARSGTVREWPPRALLRARPTAW